MSQWLAGQRICSCFQFKRVFKGLTIKEQVTVGGILMNFPCAMYLSESRNFETIMIFSRSVVADMHEFN
ncbi:hypothetical protein EMIT0P171_120179 [Pseudomonas sp. IT-P171]